MAIINQKHLKQYLKLNYNVLFKGLHGVGKTAIIKDVFESAGLRWKYFSASTLDPWVDFVGVPKVVTAKRPDAHGGEADYDVLKLIRPEFIENDEVDAIFFDELNRAPDKVINAIMELNQFKSINGHKLNNLKVIWAAINPEDDDDTYSVNHLDPAHLDRFHVHMNVPFKVDEQYFRGKYPDTGQTFIDWWSDKQMPDEIRMQISPRRLDYAADAYKNDCRLEDFLPAKSGIKKLREMLTGIPYHSAIKQITTPDQAKDFLRDVNNATRMLDMAKSGDSVSIDFFVKYASQLPKELVEPVAEFVYAIKNGKTAIKSIEELITILPSDKGNQGTAAIINNAEIDNLYISGGSLEEELKELLTSKRNFCQKLANQLSDVMISCAVKPEATSTVSTLERIFWGSRGRPENRPTHVYNIIKTLTKLDPTLFTSNKADINRRLYSNKIVPELNFLH